MGLKTTNYLVKRTGAVLPEAYALIHSINAEKNSVRVVFGVYANREKAKEYSPEETKQIHFVWDRKSDIAKTAYELAKGQTVEEHINHETGEKETITVNGVFYGWTDDIVSG